MKIESNIEKLKNKFVKSQTKLYEKSQRVSTFRSTIRSRCGTENVQMVYVLFRSMEGRARALKAYQTTEKPWWSSFLFTCLFCPLVCLFRTYRCCKRCCGKPKLSKKEEQDQSLLFMQKFKIKVEEAENPEHIHWDNYSTNCCSRCCVRGIKAFLFLFLFGLFCSMFLLRKMIEEPFLEEYPQYILHQLKPHNASKVIPITTVMNDFKNGTLSWHDDKYKKIEQVGYIYAYCEFMTLILNKEA
jgi:hypothetical protein